MCYLDFNTCNLEYLRNLVTYTLFEKALLRDFFYPWFFLWDYFRKFNQFAWGIYLYLSQITFKTYIQFTWFKTYLNNAMVKTMSSRRDTNPPAIYDEMWDFSFIILSHSGFEFAISLNGTACLTSWKKGEKNTNFILFYFSKKFRIFSDFFFSDFWYKFL